jgi:hypothetical protein
MTCSTDFPGTSYACAEEGPGTYAVTVTVRGESQTKSSPMLTSDQCHVRGSAKLDFTFDLEPPDATDMDAAAQEGAALNASPD